MAMDQGYKIGRCSVDRDVSISSIWEEQRFLVVDRVGRDDGMVFGYVTRGYNTCTFVMFGVDEIFASAQSLYWEWLMFSGSFASAMWSLMLTSPSNPQTSPTWTTLGISCRPFCINNI